MVKDLLKKLHTIKFDIDQSVEIKDVKRLKKLDVEYTEIWDEILSFEADNEEDARTVLMFLLNQMNERWYSNGNSEKISKQIVHLYDQKNSIFLKNTN